MELALLFDPYNDEIQEVKNVVAVKKINKTNQRKAYFHYSTQHAAFNKLR